MVCPRCGSNVADCAAHCGVCFAKFAQVAPPSPPTAVPTPSVPAYPPAPSARIHVQRQRRSSGTGSAVAAIAAVVLVAFSAFGYSRMAALRMRFESPGSGSQLGSTQHPWVEEIVPSTPQSHRPPVSSLPTHDGGGVPLTGQNPVPPMTPGTGYQQGTGSAWRAGAGGQMPQGLQDLQRRNQEQIDASRQRMEQMQEQMRAQMQASQDRMQQQMQQSQERAQQHLQQMQDRMRSFGPGSGPGMGPGPGFGPPQ